MLRRLSPVVIALLLFAAGPVFAEEPVSTKEIQVWKKGDDTREFDLTTMSPGAREALAKQMRDKGYVPYELRVLKAYADGRIESKIKTYGDKKQAEATDPKAIDKKALEADIKKLIEGGGRLPEGYVPHGTTPLPPKPPLPPVMRPDSRVPGLPGVTQPRARLDALAPSMGKLLERYLEVKDDPVRGPVFERVIRALAKGLQDVPTKGTAAVTEPMRTLVMAGVRDPKAGPAWMEVVQILHGGPSAGGRAPGRPGAPSSPPLFPGAKATPKPARPALGGAVLEPRFTPPAGPGQAPSAVLEVTSVAKGSLAERMSLEVGDQILTLDDKAPTPTALVAAQEVLDKGGKLRLRVRRRNGETETLEIEFDAE